MARQCKRGPSQCRPVWIDHRMVARGITRLERATSETFETFRRRRVTDRAPVAVEHVVKAIDLPGLAASVAINIHDQDPAAIWSS